MRIRFIIAAVCMYGLNGACSDPTADIEQGKVQKVQTSEIEDKDEHTESLEASTGNEITENLKALKEAEARRKAAEAAAAAAPAEMQEVTEQPSGPAQEENMPVPEQRPEEFLSIVQTVPGEKAFTLGSSAGFAKGMDAGGNAELAAALEGIVAKNSVAVNVSCVGNYPCPLNFSIEKTAWDSLDTAGALKATVSPAKMTLPAGETRTVVVSVDVGTDAPVMQGQHMNLMITSDDAEQKKVYSQELKFSVQPVMDIYMMGGAVENGKGEIWSTGQPDEAARTVMEFKQATTVNVHVLDPSGTVHVMHGAGAIDHQNTGDDARFGGAAAPYSFLLQPGQQGRIYCHDHERGTLGQDLRVDAAQ